MADQFSKMAATMIGPNLDQPRQNGCELYGRVPASKSTFVCLPTGISLATFLWDMGKQN